MIGLGFFAIFLLGMSGVPTGTLFLLAIMLVFAISIFYSVESIRSVGCVCDVIVGLLAIARIAYVVGTAWMKIHQ